jgi:eukaryotic-like serine/threonine-protein kinase
VLVASRTTLWALNATDGSLLWKFHRGAVSWPTTGAPAVAGGLVYVGLGSSTQFWALDINTGRVSWAFDTLDRITSTPVVDSATVYIATWHGVIFALDRLSGKKRWLYSLNSSKVGQSVVDGVGGSMALANGHLYVGDYRGSVLCLSAWRGTLAWRYSTGAQVLSTPVIAAGLVYVGSDDGYFYALDTRSGRPAWRYATGEVRSSAALANGHLYVGSLNGNMYALA